MPETTGARREGRAPRVNLRPHQPICRGGRADKDQPGGRDGACEIGILGEKTVAGMNRFRAALQRRLDDALNLPVTFGRRRRADEIRLVGEAHMERRRVRLGVDGDRRDI